MYVKQILLEEVGNVLLQSKVDLLFTIIKITYTFGAKFKQVYCPCQDIWVSSLLSSIPVMCPALCMSIPNPLCSDSWEFGLRELSKKNDILATASAVSNKPNIVSDSGA